MVTTRSGTQGKPERGRVITYKARDGKDRPGVLLLLRGSQAMVVAGTGSEPAPHQEKGIKVDNRSQYGRSLRLSKPTWYKRSAIEVIPVSAIIRCGNMCPPGLLLQLESLLQEEP
jgi:hypothetical protein